MVCGMGDANEKSFIEKINQVENIHIRWIPSGFPIDLFQSYFSYLFSDERQSFPILCK